MEAHYIKLTSDLVWPNKTIKKGTVVQFNRTAMRNLVKDGYAEWSTAKGNYIKVTTTSDEEE